MFTTHLNIVLALIIRSFIYILSRIERNIIIYRINRDVARVFQEIRFTSIIICIIRRGNEFEYDLFENQVFEWDYETLPFYSILQYSILEYLTYIYLYITQNNKT